MFMKSDYQAISGKTQARRFAFAFTHTLPALEGGTEAQQARASEIRQKTYDDLRAMINDEASMDAQTKKFLRWVIDEAIMIHVETTWWVKQHFVAGESWVTLKHELDTIVEAVEMTQDGAIIDRQ